ncbi:hypothetical protein [Marmoricola sp. RAF53]|uniref:hypothetical protein n=1 Tax=Marmoricola sp. RAF53 TaxID=3233059 RepID=UPI003F99A371
MARIETGRLARNPFFVLAALVTFGLSLYMGLTSTHDTPGDLLSWTVIPAFFVGLTSLVLMARQTRSTEAAAEALTAAPGSEARRTQALLAACLLPAAVGLAYVVFMIVLTTIKDPAPQEWWFGTTSDLQVWAILLANAPVACFGGAALGVLTGRWLRFPGAAAVVVVALVVVDMLGQAFTEEDLGSPVLRLWTPWATWQSGTDTDGTASLYGGNAVWYLVYTLCLCAAAALAAIWHDRAARTTQLKRTFVAVVVAGLLALTLAMTTGHSDNRVSDPVPWMVG